MQIPAKEKVQFLVFTVPLEASDDHGGHFVSPYGFYSLDPKTAFLS